MEWLDFITSAQVLQEWGTSVLQSEVGKWTIAFLIAERVHRKGIAKIMTVQFDGVTASIDNVGRKLSADLVSHSKQLGELKDGFNNLDRRVSMLEAPKGE